MSTPIVVLSLRPWHIYQLKKIFLRGLNTDFGYFPPDYIKATKRQNSLLHFFSAWLNPKRLILVAQTPSGEITGFIIASIINSDECYIFWIYVSPKYRGKGIGKMLINKFLTESRDHQLKKIVLATHNMVDFYKKFNFTVRDDQTFVIEKVNMYIMEASVNEKN